MKTIKTALATIAVIAIAGPALAADFAALDVNKDGQLSFDEYKVAATAEGKTVTLAAWEFTRMSQGDAVVTQDEFFFATALADDSYVLQPGLVSEPVAVDVAPMEFEAPVESSSDAVEMMEPPDIDEEPVREENTTKTPAPIIMEKPIDIDSVVAGEVEISSDIAPEDSVDEPNIETQDNEDIESDEIY